MITLIIVVLFFGIKFNIAYNYNANTLSINIVLLRRFYVFNIMLRVINDKLFITTNDTNPRLIKQGKKKSLKGFKLPKIKLYASSLYLNIITDKIALASIICGFINNFVSFFQHNKTIIMDDINYTSNVGVGATDIKVVASFIIRFSLIKIIFSILHTIVRNEVKNAIKSNRRTHGMHA